MAVRSSAIGEDGAEASFAGQYDTVLGVRGEAELGDAVERCVASLEAERASAYQREQANDANGRGPAMCVVVQQMVDARVAGVLFTVDPITSRRAHCVIDAVRGLGESLVSGQASADHYRMSRGGRTLESRQVEGTPIL